MTKSCMRFTLWYMHQGITVNKNKKNLYIYIYITVYYDLYILDSVINVPIVMHIAQKKQALVSFSR